MASIEEELEDDGRTSRMTWIRRILVVFYIGLCFLISSAFIYVTGLQVGISFEVFGRPQILAGHPAIFRVWARDNSGPSPTALDNPAIELTLLDQGGAPVAQGTVEPDGQDYGEVSIRVPASLTSGTYTMRAVLRTSGEERERLEFSIDIESPDEPQPTLGGKTMLRSKLWEGEDGPHRVELIAPDGVLTSFMSNRVFVRVTDRATNAPVAGARLSFTIKYGNVESEIPKGLTTDTLGIAALTLAPVGETEWSIESIASDGTVSHSRSVLKAAPRGYTLEMESAGFAKTSALAFELQTLQPGQPIFFELVDPGAHWLASTKRPIENDLEKVTWEPDLDAVPSARLLTLIACPDEVTCAGGHARHPILWTPQAPSATDAITAFMKELRDRDMDVAWLDHIQKHDLSALDSASADDLRELLRYRVPSQYTGLDALLVSDDHTGPRLEAFKKDFRSQAYTLLVITLLAGMLIVLAFGLTSLVRRQRETALVLAGIDSDNNEDDDDDDEEEREAEAAARARRLRMAYWIAGTWGVVALLMIVAFVWGILLLFQHL